MPLLRMRPLRGKHCVASARSRSSLGSLYRLLFTIILSLPWREQTRHNSPREALGDHSGKAQPSGFSWGCSSEIDSTSRVIFTADAYAREGRRFIVLADEGLSAFLELEGVTRVALGVPRKS
jgi:hypothetical protein